MVAERLYNGCWNRGDDVGYWQERGPSATEGDFVAEREYCVASPDAELNSC